MAFNFPVPAHLYLIYLSVILAVIVPPGPTALLCVAHGARHGAWRTGATVLGGIAAALCLMLVSALGLGAAIAASELAFQIIKWVGAAYLVYLGVATWRAPAPVTRFSSHPGDAATPAKMAQSQLAKRLRDHFATGFMVGISNPKDLLFFGALFPQFLQPTQALVPQLAVLGLTWVLVEGLVMGAYAAVGARLIRGMTRWGGVRGFNRVTGAAFVALGGWLALGK